jgi:hypothetical protein
MLLATQYENGFGIFSVLVLYLPAASLLSGASAFALSLKKNPPVDICDAGALFSTIIGFGSFVFIGRNFSGFMEFCLYCLPLILGIVTFGSLARTRFQTQKGKEEPNQSSQPTPPSRRG